MSKFETFRKEYPEFIYHGFSASNEENKIKVKYHFEIKGLSEFNPEWSFPNGKNLSIDDKTVKNLLFSIGMVELVSYWKITCSPLVKVKCGKLSENQADWWKKQYFYGLGEFFYRNGIDTDFSSFMKIVSEGEVFSVQKKED